MEKLIAWQWQLLTGFFNIVLCCCVAYVIIARGITTMDLLHVRKLCFSCDLFLSYFKIHNAISVTRPNTWTRKISQFVFTALSPYCLVDLSLLLPICYWLYACHNSQCQITGSFSIEISILNQLWLNLEDRKGLPSLLTIDL